MNHQSAQRNSNWHQSSLFLRHPSTLWSPPKNGNTKNKHVWELIKTGVKLNSCVYFDGAFIVNSIREISQLMCNYSPCFWQYPYIKASFLVLQYRQLGFYPETTYWKPHYIATGTSTIATKLANASPHYTQTT